MFFSTDLSWSKHVHHIMTKAYNQLHFIQRTFKAASTPICVKKKLYLSLILPILSYASPVWRPYHMKDIKALELFQKRATKYILNYKNSDYKSRLSELNLLPLMSRLEYYDIMFFVSCWNHPGEHFNIRDYISSSLIQVSPPGHNHLSNSFTPTQNPLSINTSSSIVYPGCGTTSSH